MFWGSIQAECSSTHPGLATVFSGNSEHQYKAWMILYVIVAGTTETASPWGGGEAKSSCCQERKNPRQRLSRVAPDTSANLMTPCRGGSSAKCPSLCSARGLPWPNDGGLSLVNKVHFAHLQMGCPATGHQHHGIEPGAWQGATESAVERPTEPEESESAEESRHQSQANLGRWVGGLGQPCGLVADHSCTPHRGARRCRGRSSSARARAIGLRVGVSCVEPSIRAEQPLSSPWAAALSEPPVHSTPPAVTKLRANQQVVIGSLLTAEESSCA